MTQPADSVDRASLYIHIPWCRARCGYCDFNTYVPSDLSQVSRYVAAVLLELAQASQQLEGRTITTVYFGGGTPTMMSATHFRQIMDSITALFDISPDAEITTEANPETVNASLLCDLRETGINRISIGMQSVVPRVLLTLDRVHTPSRVGQAVMWARAAGFSNLSLDLIYGTPGESISDWEQSLEAALGLEPDHISAYALILEPATPLARRIASGEFSSPDDDDQADKYLKADQIMSAAGLEWYEISNWAKPGNQCQHNLVYWHSGVWWGIGAGAHSHVSGRRWWNQKNPSAYCTQLEDGASPVAGFEELSQLERQCEAIMLGLRLASGIKHSQLSEQGLARAKSYIASGHLEQQGTHLVCTTTGRLIADGIIGQIID